MAERFDLLIRRRHVNARPTITAVDKGGRPLFSDNSRVENIEQRREVAADYVEQLAQRQIAATAAEVERELSDCYTAFLAAEEQARLQQAREQAATRAADANVPSFEDAEAARLRALAQTSPTVVAA